MMTAARSTSPVTFCLLVLALEIGAVLTKGSACRRVVARAGDAELELAPDASVTGSVVMTAQGHDSKVIL
jgi:hypothetical protein